MPVYVWPELSRSELGVILPNAVVVLPTAATEQHGPHLATGHDALMLGEIVRRAGERIGPDVDVVIAPGLPFGSSAHHLSFGGTLSLSSETYLHVVMDLLRSMITDGARRVLVINGHGGNHELNEIAVRDVALTLPEDVHASLAAASWWTLAASAILADERFAGMRVPGHAGAAETSMMLAWRPELVRADPPSRESDLSLGTPIPGARIEGEVPWAEFDGYTDSPAAATAEIGALALEIAADSLAEAITAMAGTRAG